MPVLTLLLLYHPVEFAYKCRVKDVFVRCRPERLVLSAEVVKDDVKASSILTTTNVCSVSPTFLTKQ